MYVAYDDATQRVLNDIQRTRLSCSRFWLLAHPTPLSRQQLFSLSQSSCVSLVDFPDERGGGWAWSQIKRPRGILALYTLLIPSDWRPPKTFFLALKKMKCKISHGFLESHLWRGRGGVRCVCGALKKKKISSHMRKFRSEQLQSLIWGREMRKFLVIYEEAVSNIWLVIPSEFPYKWGKFSFLFYQCALCALCRGITRGKFYRSCKGQKWPVELKHNI